MHASDWKLNSRGKTTTTVIHAGQNMFDGLIIPENRSVVWENSYSNRFISVEKSVIERFLKLVDFSHGAD